MDPNLPLAHDRPTLMTLAQELKDMICGSAFAENKKVEVISREGWDFKVEQLQRDPKTTNTIRPFPRPKVEEFLVSKEFFVSAAKPYIQSRIFCGSANGSFDDLDQFIRKGIGSTWLRSMETDLLGLILTADLVPSLTALTVTVGEYDFSSARNPCQVELEDVDFREHIDFQPVLEMRGLTEFSLIATTPWDYDFGGSNHKLRWDRNMQRLEAFIRSQVTLPKAETAGKKSKTRPTSVLPLYPGSRVSATSSKLFDRQGYAFNRTLPDECISAAVPPQLPHPRNLHNSESDSDTLEALWSTWASESDTE